jgi:predicted metal-binding membrane protein
MDTSTASGPLRRLTGPVAGAVALVVAVAWYVAWATSDFSMMLMDPMRTPLDAASLAAFFALMVVMMVAMMLPSALPMILAFHGMTRLEGGKVSRPPDATATALFVAPYFLVWGLFSVMTLLLLMSLGLFGAFEGALAYAPAAVLLVAGGYQLTRPKEVCLSHCQSPMGFVMLHWRSGRAGAVRMGLHHAVYCLGCCWLLMLVLFVAGAMNLVWMGVVSIMIFAEKVSPPRYPVSRALGAILLILGAIVAAGAFLG